MAHPLLASIFLVQVSLHVRLKMKESRIFEQLKTSGITST